MFDLIQLPSLQTSIPLWLWFCTTVFAASVPIIVGIAGRKRRSSVRAENRKAEAEARNIEIQSIGELLEDLSRTRKEFEEAGSEHRKRENFLRDQVQWHEELSIRARKAAHAAINENQRAYFAIQLRDEALSEAIALLKSSEVNHDNLSKVPPFEAKRYDEITNFQALPLPPQRTDR